ncbi:MAG: hypothetical protein GXP15_10370, partial [Gammaproteobacteria bacterium]|nr:hypothetical protein [Gammaproteobacteria bacterium]
MRNLIRNTCLIVALAAGVVPDAFAQDFANNPNRIFAGCDDDARAPASSNPRDRIEQRGGPTVDRFTQRTFASFTMDDVERGISDEMSVLCWARLDGVWQESRSIVSDSSKNDGTIWGASSRELISLTNGNYTTLGHIVIVETENPERTIYLATGLSGAPFVRFQSTDEMKFEDVFKRGGPQKTYIANNPFAFGSRMTVDVTRSGRVRLRLGNRQFLRPKPGVSESVADNQLAADDAFLIGYQLDNLPATRRGYDIISQDPFFLLNNSKAEVFAEVDPRQYSITEKRIVPVGFKLVREDSQGTVYRKEVMSSEQSIQETVSHTMGGSVSGAGFAGPLPVQGKVSLDASIATSKSMSQNQSIARAIGYSRTKKYALVVDHPYVQLSDDFIDAIDDAR